MFPLGLASLPRVNTRSRIPFTMFPLYLLIPFFFRTEFLAVFYTPVIEHSRCVHIVARGEGRKRERERERERNISLSRSKNVTRVHY